MGKKAIVQFYRNEDADCFGEYHTLVIGDEIHSVCSCGSGCNYTFNLRECADEFNSIIDEMDGIEEGCDFEDEEDY